MSSSDSDSDSSERKRHKKHRKKEKKSKKHKKEKKHKKKKSHKKRDRRGSSDSESSGSDRSFEAGGRDEWVEKVLPAESKPKVERDDWMNCALIPTYSKEVKRDEKKPASVDQYDPKTSVRELNPHWRNGGSGLPSFRRPVDDDEDDGQLLASRVVGKEPTGRDSGRSGGWRKEAPRKVDNNVPKEQSKSAETSPSDDGMFMTDQQLNDLGAKIIKAEIMGNSELAASLREKLEKAKAYRSEIKDSAKPNQETSAKRKDDHEEQEMHFTAGHSKRENASHNKRQRKIQEHLPGGNLADKFRSERFENDNMDAQFFKASAKLDREASNLENIFDHGRASSSTSGQSNEEKIARDMNKQSRVQADCERCLNSSKFSSDCVISMGKNIFLAVPSWKALQPKHCLIVPVSHCPALTLMDEDVFQDLIDTCKALKRMYAAHKQEVIFFETVRYINRSPHAYVQCVPSDNYEMAPFYFKKAIIESETEWAMNKKLHNMQGLEIRRTVPKGLPYFWVNFNLENGFAHVIEDQEEFPVTFASETIAGILGLDTRDWRKPGREHNPKQRVKEFLDWWKEFDCLTKE